MGRPIIKKNAASGSSIREPEKALVERVLLQAIVDVDTLANIPNETTFRNRQNDLWAFFNSRWFFDIIDFLEIGRDNEKWEEIRAKIWNCSMSRKTPK